MNKLSFVSLAAVAACSGAPVIQQSAPTAPKADPKTEAEVTTALETAKLIKNKCIGMLPDGGTSFWTEEIGEKVRTTLGITKGSQNGGTITEETCECIYRIDIPTFVHEKTSCEYHYKIRDTENGEFKTEHTKFSKMSHIEKPDGSSFTSSYTATYGTNNPPSVTSGFETEISANGSGCKTSTDDTSDWDKIPYDLAKLGSCEYFAAEVSISVGEVRDAICEQLQKLKQEGKEDRPPPLCSKGKVNAPAPGTNE